MGTIESEIASTAPCAVEGEVRSESDVVLVRHLVRRVASQQGLSRVGTEALATAATEVASNLLLHAGEGVVRVAPVLRGPERGVVVIAVDRGPGIADLALALKDGYSSGRGLGLGLSSARRLVDEFVVESVPGKGTQILLRKWAS